MSASLRFRYSVGKFVLSEARTLVASYFSTVAALIEDFAVYTGVMYACMCVCVWTTVQIVMDGVQVHTHSRVYNKMCVCVVLVLVRWEVPGML